MDFLNRRFANFLFRDLGRFLSPDSIVPAKGNPQGLDRYAYVANNPISRNDASGHCWGIASGIRGLPSYGTTCNNIDMALTIVKSDEATLGQKAIAGGYVALEGAAHAALVVGSIACASNPLACVAGAKATILGGTATTAAEEACADGDCTNEVVQGVNVVKTAAERGQEAVQKVVDLFGDDVVAKNLDYKVYGPKGFSSDIDVVVGGETPKFIEVGGYAKSFDMSHFGAQINNLYKLAQLEGAEAYFYYVEGTPQQVIDYATRVLGEDHVLPVP